MSDAVRRKTFEALVWPHMGAAYNFARWMVRNEQDAEDLVQDAALRAYRALDATIVRDARTWFLAIVRNGCSSFLTRNRTHDATIAFDETAHAFDAGARHPEAALLEGLAVERLRGALERLPSDFREVIVLRELEGLSYKEIADVAGIPIGTVMSRLARARERLQGALVRGEGARA